MLESEIENVFKASFHFQGLNAFYITNNNIIQELTHYIFNGVTFNFIYMENTTLRNIDDTFFTGLGQTLNQLYLDGNQLETFPYSVLPTLPRLNYLNLSSNAISSIPSPIPQNNITTLCFEKNQVAILEKDTFSNCKELTDLYLEQNVISTIVPGTNNRLFV